jgi:DnaK suppressor protein
MSSPVAVLKKKQTELLADIARLKGEVREAGAPEVRDQSDAATATQSSAEAMDEVTMESQTLEQVEDALKRVADGTYGKCVICGKAIGAARLEAIPWTPYCPEHAR